ncbi:XRE family transcriptional regulator [Ruminococcus bromii]|nr:XRE family transcriptional regulator [Ruminococcus bromii]
MIGISPEYLSKIENGLRTAPNIDTLGLRTAPNIDTLEIIANKLLLSPEEKEIFYDLAAESKSYLSLAPDLLLYIRENTNVHKALRLAKRCGANGEDWQILIEFITEKYL